MDARELLLKAADHIEQYGKISGKWIPNEAISESSYEVFDRNCPACVGGAIAIEVSGGKDYIPNFIRRPSERRTMGDALEMIVTRLGLEFENTFSHLDTVIEWSDASSQEQVVAGLRKAAG